MCVCLHIREHQVCDGSLREKAFLRVNIKFWVFLPCQLAARPGVSPPTFLPRDLKGMPDLRYMKDLSVFATKKVKLRCSAALEGQ